MATRSVVHPPVRLQAAPVCDPPYDDERPPDWWRAGPLEPPLDLPPPAGPGHGGGPVGTGARGPAAGSAPVSRIPNAAPIGAVPATAPATTAAAVRFVNTCLEIFNGYRPVNHFRSLAHPLAAATVMAEMSRALRRFRRATNRRTGEHRTTGHYAREHAADSLAGLPAGGARTRWKLRRMRTCEPRSGVAEIAVVIAAVTDGRQLPGDGEPVWALAYRLEQQRGRWLCTAAQLL